MKDSRDVLTFFAAARLQARLDGKRKPTNSELVSAFFHGLTPQQLANNMQFSRRRRGRKQRNA